MRNTSILTRVLALVLSVVLVLTGMPMAVFAEEIATPTELEQPEETTTATEDVVEEVPVTEEEQPAEEEAPAEGEAPVLDDSQLPADVVDELVPSDDPVEEAPEDLPADDGEQEQLPDQEEFPEENADEIPPVEDEIIVEDEPTDDMPEEEELYFEDEIATEPEEITEDEHPVKVMLEASGYAYVMTDDAVSAYADSALQEYMCSIAPGSALLVTAFIELDAMDVLEVQFMADACELAYVDAADLPEAVLTDDDLAVLYQTAPFALILLDGMEAAVFAATVEYPIEDEQPVEVVPPVEDIPVEQPTEEDAVVEAPIEDPIEQLPEESGDELPEEDPLPVEDEELPGEVVVDPEGEILLPEDGELLPDASEEMTEDEQEPVDEVWVAQEGDFVLVSPDTRAFLSVDDTAAEDYEGDLAIGFFVNDAAVQVETVEQDSLDRWWYRITFMYGDDHADGSLKWTDFDTLYVLAEETEYTDAQDFDVTDYAFPFAPRAMTFSLRSTTAMNGFSLRDISASLGNFYAGQTGLHGSSGRDSEYLQIATMAGHGKIYATPHFLEGYVVYCLEHLLPGPGERVSGGSNQPTGPYAVVDLASYMNTPGYSGVMYKESTMHAIGWVLRHTVPFMELDRSDSDNRTWSRVAGQFAIREVIKQLEGSQYVRDYWQMEDFYAASGNAPAVYLEYARWLATNGIARGSMTGKITVSNKSVSSVNGRTVGTVKLTTDADLIRISKSYGTVTGHTYGEDGSYYYLNSGDTITITSTASSFSFKAESMSSPEEEAGFFVGVPQEAIQKLLIPIEGLPYPLKSVSVSFEIPYGSISVTKKDAASGAVLAGAVFDLMSGSTVIQTQTTGANGVVTFSNIAPGTYTIRERTAPQGYTLGSVNVQNVTVTNGQTSGVTFKNDKTTAKIKIRKTDQVTGSALAGATFTITRLSAPATDNGAGVGEVITITTNDNGVAETGWLKWGKYKIEETAAPDGYLNSGYSTVVECYENGKTYSFDVENEPMAGFIQIVKTNSLDDQPIAGVQFDIFHADGSGLAGSMTTNDEGVAISPPLRKGKYTVKEHANPEGYVAELVELQAEVRSKETTCLSAENKPIQGKIRIVKKDQLTGNMLAGAEFTITQISGLPSHNGAGNGKVVAVITTDKNGVAESPLLTYGVYKVEETKAPEHFVNAGFSTEVSINEDNLQTYEISVENEPTKGWIKLTKADALDGHTIEGVRFDIYFAGSTELAGTMTTDANGVAVSPALPKGKYTVKEHANPEGYVAELVELEAVVSSDDTTILEATNQPIQGKIRIVKKDQLTGDTLAGAEFTISRVSGLPSHNGADNGEVVAVITTDKNGIAESPLLTYGVYRVEETKVPEHFVDAGFSTEVSITKDNLQTYEISVENEPTKGWIKLTKADALDGHAIAGVQFDIYYAGSTDLAGSMTTDANGVAVSPALPKGKYTVKENANPEGYVAELVELEAVVSSDDTTVLEATNQPIQGKIRIVKKDQLTGDTLAGAEFTITRASGLPSHNGAGNGEVVAVITTGENGVAESPLLTYGVYKVEETVVPEHFVDNGFSVDVTIADDNLKTYEVVVENEPTKGWIRLTKTNSLDSHPIAGVQFNIYYYDEFGSGLAASMVTDENGVATSPALRKGKYLVQEVDEATGYVSDLVELTAMVESDETTYLSVTNQPIQGVLRIRKLDELTGEALAGAEFTITRISGLPSHNGDGDGEVVAVITSDAEGVAVSPLLTYGLYKVEETKVPEHFVDKGFSTEMVINEENFCTYEITVENEPTKGWISLTKTDRRNGNPIAGVVFDVYYNDQYGSGLATTIVTDENGIAMTEPLRKGKYIVQERNSTAGYVFEEILLDATVHSDETTKLAVTNQPVMVKLKLYKRDVNEYDGDPAAVPGTRGDGVLTGAEFQVLAAENILDRQGNVVHSKGDVVVSSLLTAGADASVTTDDLWPGKYEVIELTPPKGYQPAKGSIIVDARSAAKQSEEAVVTYEGVIKNEILYGAQAIVKILGEHTVEADPTRVETPEKGAEFRVYLKAAGSYENARKFERDVLKTDKNGYAKTKELPYGIYVLEQTKGKEGYEIKGPIIFEIDGTESLVNPPPLTLSDKPILYRLKFVKTDSETGKTIILSNTTFKLKDAAGEYVKQKVFYPREQVIDTFTTDETGSVTLPETVTWGLYTIEEVKSPEGYLIRTEDFSVFVGNNGDQPGQTYELEIEIPNDPVKGRILLDKTGLQLVGFKKTKDAWGNEVHTPEYEEGYLAGAVFEVRAAETITGKDGTVWFQQGEVVDTITTTEQGGDASKELPLGKYELVEIKAPEGYFFDPAPIPVDLAYANDHTAVVELRVEVGNDCLPAKISLMKEIDELRTISSGKNGVKSILNTAPGEGFVFGLFRTHDMPYAYGTLMADTLVATGATDRNGMLTFEGIYPHGDYYVKELQAKAGWKMSADRYDLSITPDRKAADENVLRVILVDPIHNDLVHGRVTLTKTDITGEKTLPGAVIEVYNDKGEVVYRDTTDEYGRIASIPVTPGRYTFREIYAPDGYALNDAIMSFTVDGDGVVTGTTTIRDDYTRFSIAKCDENEAPLSGVEFSLIRPDGSTLMTVRTNRSGIATFEKVPHGTYRIVETRPLAGYLPAEMDVQVNVDGTFLNPEEPLAVIVNVPNEVLIQKVDQDGKPLSGAEFALIDAFGDRFAVATSDANGQVRFHKVPYGSYTIRELKAPDGYLASKEEITLKVDADFRSTGTPMATVVNHQKRVKFIKVDTSGKFLPGVEFSLLNAVTYEVVETVTSNEKGEFLFTQFDYGDWIIRETAAPDGYNRMEDYLLHVDADWTEPDPITLINIPSTYMFFKSDNRRNALAGVTFVVEDEKGKVVQEVVSGEDGVVYIYGLMPGKYTIRETATVEGFAVSDDTIEIVIDEKYTVPTKLKRFVNYPSIATGVDVSPTTLTWIGVGLSGAAGVILLLGRRKRKAAAPKRK